jgi:hypothetical protein
MDVFLSEGMEIIFKVALSLLTIAKDDLLSLDMEGMLKVSRQNNQVRNGLFTIFSHYFSFSKRSYLQRQNQMLRV